MRKKMDLKTFSLYQYLKEQHAQNPTVPYFLADQDTYREASIQFPFRTFTYGIGITYSGTGGEFRIGNTTYHTKAGSLCTIGPGIVSQWMGDYSSTHDTVYFTEDLFKTSLKTSFLTSLPFFLPGGDHVITLQDEHVQKMKTLMETIKYFKMDADIVTGLVHSLLMLTIQCHKIPDIDKQSSTSVRQKITRNFKSLVSKHFLEKKDVAFYAGELNITPKYLSEVLVAETGRTAKALIEEHLFMEARSLLRQTSMSVQEICHWLGYADSSYFSKAFRKQEGMTPLQYRNL